MRDSISGAWLFGIVITFMAFFIAFITISINYSKAYEMKTKMITVIEQYDGLNPMSVEIINKISSAYGYRKTNGCKVKAGEDFVGIRDGVAVVNPDGPQNICITRDFRPGDEFSDDKYYYNLEVFFGFDLPLFGNIFNFRVDGETNEVNYPSSTDYFGV